MFDKLKEDLTKIEGMVHGVCYDNAYIFLTTLEKEHVEFHHLPVVYHDINDESVLIEWKIGNHSLLIEFSYEYDNPMNVYRIHNNRWYKSGCFDNGVIPSDITNWLTDHAGSPRRVDDEEE